LPPEVLKEYMGPTSSLECIVHPRLYCIQSSTLYNICCWSYEMPLLSDFLNVWHGRSWSTISLCGSTLAHYSYHSLHYLAPTLQLHKHLENQNLFRTNSLHKCLNKPTKVCCPIFVIYMLNCFSLFMYIDVWHEIWFLYM
jgi:hypothetical protein